MDGCVVMDALLGPRFNKTQKRIQRNQNEKFKNVCDGNVTMTARIG